MQYVQIVEARCHGCDAQAPGLQLEFALEPRKRNYTHGYKTHVTRIHAVPEGWALYYLSCRHLPEDLARYTLRCPDCIRPGTYYNPIEVGLDKLPIKVDEAYPPPTR